MAAQRLSRPDGSVFIFPSPSGRRWGKDNFNHRVLKPALEKAELGKVITFHDLRHTFASLMIAAEVQPKMLQTLMGHTDIRMTMGTYGHLFEGADAAAMEHFDRFLASQTAPSVPMQKRPMLMASF